MNYEKKESLKSGLISAAFGFTLSFLVNYFLVPFPETLLVNAFNNGISGFFSGFMGGFMGLFMYLKMNRKVVKFTESDIQ